MKLFYIITILFTIAISCSIKEECKSYKIKDTIWCFKIPKEYELRTDNFEQTRKLGAEYIEKDTTVEIVTDDKVLVSLGKSEDKSMNMFMASVSKSNTNIEKYTLKGYAHELKDFFLTSPSIPDSNTIVQIGIEEFIIDNIMFYNIKKEVEYTKEQYSYVSELIVSEIDGLEINFVVMTNNEKDRNNFLNALRSSKFNK